MGHFVRKVALERRAEAAEAIQYHSHRDVYLTREALSFEFGLESKEAEKCLMVTLPDGVGAVALLPGDWLLRVPLDPITGPDPGPTFYYWRMPDDACRAYWSRMRED